MIKRIFYIQNPIALLVANKVIEINSYDKNECLFIFGRNMNAGNNEIKSIPWDSYRQQYSWNFIFGIRANNKIKEAIKEFVEVHVKDKFTLYTSSYSLWFLEYLALHPKCSSYNFLEEGASSFFTKKERKNIHKSSFYSKKIFYYLKILLSHKFSYFQNPFKAEKLLETSSAIYTFSKDGFAEYNQRVVIDIPFEKKESLASIKAVFAPWYIVESGIIQEEIYFRAMRKVFEKIYQIGEQNIHYKFHPQHLVKKKYIPAYEKLFHEFAGKINFIPLDVNISLENLAYSSKANFYVDVSSLALYASTCGSKIYSYCDILIEESPDFKNFPLPIKLKKIVFPGNMLLQKSLEK